MASRNIECFKNGLDVPGTTTKDGANQASEATAGSRASRLTFDETNKMIRTRIIGSVAIVLAVIYLFTGGLLLLALRPPLVGLILGLLVTSILLLVAGLAVLACGIGLWLNWPWAIRSWLLCTIVLVAFHGLWLLKNIPLGVGPSDLIELGVVLGIAAFSWASLVEQRSRTQEAE